MTRIQSWFGELIAYRELLINLVVRDVKTRYKNSVLGFVWSLLSPLAMMVVFTVVFGVLYPNNKIQNFPIFLLSGLLPWNFFSTALLAGSNSVVTNSNLVKKVYFPREILPISTVLAYLVNFLLALVVLFAVLLVFQAPISPWLWQLPIVILLQTVFMIGLALFLSTLNVFYRDTMLVMDVVMLAWFFLTPIFYSTSSLPQTIEIAGFTLDFPRLYFILNPMASIINMYRDLLYYGYRTDLDFFLRSAITAFLALGFGYWFFTRYRGRFGEEL